MVAIRTRFVDFILLVSIHYDIPHGEVVSCLFQVYYCEVNISSLSRNSNSVNRYRVFWPVTVTTTLRKKWFHDFFESHFSKWIETDSNEIRTGFADSVFITGNIYVTTQEEVVFMPFPSLLVQNEHKLPQSRLYLGSSIPFSLLVTATLQKKWTNAFSKVVIAKCFSQN